MNMKSAHLDHDAIGAAIRSAEKKTSAEIFAVYATRSDDYRFVGYAFIAFWIFLVSALLVLWFAWGSTQQWGSGGDELPVNLFTLVWAQLVAFICGVVVLRLFPSLAILVTPRRIRHERAHGNAVKQFLAHGIHNTEGRSGVLVFVSRQERFAEILVDQAIEERLGREPFFEEVEKLIDACERNSISDGYVTVIQDLGEVLSEAFPPGAKNKNELEDRLVVL